MMGFAIALSALTIAATPAKFSGDAGATQARQEMSFTQLLGSWGTDGQVEFQFAADGSGIAYADHVQWTANANTLRLRYETGAWVSTTFAIAEGGRFLVLSSEDADGNPVKLVLERIPDHPLAVSAR